MVYGAEGMKDLICERITVSAAESLAAAFGDKECIVHLVSGKANLVIGGEGEQQWFYPLDSYDTVWIPAGTSFTLVNDGIGNLELSRYTYNAS